MIAVVTGASSGIGAEFCRALDAEGLDSIWLVARRADRLESLASELSTPCVVIPADLTDRGQLSDFVDRIGSSGERVGYLVNCAGVGRFGETWDLSSDETLSMIDLNVSALTEMCRGCIPCMGSGSHIINVCSASAYLPLEGLNVYSATKAYVRAFCNALRGELKSKGITVLEVSPGWVETDFIPLSRSSGDVPEAVFKHTVTARDVAVKAVADAKRGKRRSICGSYNRLQVFVCTHMPRAASYVWRRSLL